MNIIKKLKYIKKKKFNSKNTNININKYKSILEVMTLLLSITILTSCQSNPFMESLEQENFETIRQSTYYENSSDILKREEFDGYKDEIIKAIKGSPNIARVENSIISKKIVVKPYKVKINDLSKEVRVFLDDVEIKDKVENGMEIILTPGAHKIKYQLITPYYKEDKVKDIDTSTFKQNIFEDSTGFKFRDVIINTSADNAFLIINNTTFSKMQSGLNTIKDVPASVPLEMYLQDEANDKHVSETFVSKEGANEFNLELTKVVEDKKSTSSSVPKIIRVPQNKKPGENIVKTQTVEGLSNEPYGFPTNASILKLEPSKENELIKSIINRTKDLQRAYYEDATDGEVSSVTSYLQANSNFDFYVRKKIPELAKSKLTYKFKDIEKPSIIFIDGKNGYIEFTSIFTTSVGQDENAKETKKSEHLKYHFTFTSDNTITFTRNENIS